MSLLVYIGTAIAIWAMLSIIGNERAAQLDGVKARHHARRKAEAVAEDELPVVSAKP